MLFAEFGKSLNTSKPIFTKFRRLPDLFISNALKFNRWRVPYFHNILNKFCTWLAKTCITFFLRSENYASPTPSNLHLLCIWSWKWLLPLNPLLTELEDICWPHSSLIAPLHISFNSLLSKAGLNGTLCFLFLSLYSPLIISRAAALINYPYPLKCLYLNITSKQVYMSIQNTSSKFNIHVMLYRPALDMSTTMFTEPIWRKY